MQFSGRDEENPRRNILSARRARARGKAVGEPSKTRGSSSSLQVNRRGQGFTSNSVFPNRRGGGGGGRKSCVIGARAIEYTCCGKIAPYSAAVYPTITRERDRWRRT